jgi:hypothetical protein
MKRPPVFVFAGVFCAAAAVAAEVEERPARREGDAQVALEFEWVKMPAAEANRLLHGTLRSPREAKALRTALEESLAAGKAERIDTMLLNVMDGEDSAIEALLEEPYSTGWKMDTDGNGGISLTTTSEGARDLGGTVRASVDVTCDRRAVDVTFTALWTELSGNVVWKAGKEPVSQPAFATTKASRVSRMTSGEWTLQGMMPSFAVSDSGVPEVPDRVLLLTRATVDVPVSEGAHHDKTPHCLVICEWVGMDAAAAAALSKQFTGPDSGGALRSALTEEMAKGTAVQEDVSVITAISGKRGKDEAACEVPRPPEFKVSAPVPDGGQRIPLHTVSSGRTLEVEAKWSTGGKEWELTLDPVHGVLKESAGPPPEKKPGKDSAQAETTKCTLKMKADTTVLAATLPNSPVPGGKDRVTLLFVKLLE